MWRVVIVIGVLLLVFLFVGQNMHSIQINMPFSGGFEVRTVFLVAVVFFLGYGAAHFVAFVRDFKNRRR